jgi:hypothetical protein
MPEVEVEEIFASRYRVSGESKEQRLFGSGLAVAEIDHVIILILGKLTSHLLKSVECFVENEDFARCDVNTRWRKYHNLFGKGSL